MRMKYYPSKYLMLICIFISSTLLLGCSSSKAPFISDKHLDLAVITPDDHEPREVMISRISQVLQTANLSKKEHASLLFDRGVLYDSLGLWVLARQDFIEAVAISPKMAEIYNYLGLYLTLDEDYSSALKMFNLTLNIDPHYEYAYLNRGLNYYYMKNYKLAEKDLLTFYNVDKKDPYRVLWLYINELAYQPAVASKNLSMRASSLAEGIWGTKIVNYYLGKSSMDKLVQQITAYATPHSEKYAEILTETYFYLAKQKLITGDVDTASTFLKLALANQVYNFVEYRFALFELNKLQKTQATDVVKDTN